MSHKHLLFRIDTELDSLLVVIPWTPELVELIEQRRKAVEPLVAMKNSFHRATFFWYGMEVYTLPEELENLVDYDGDSMAIVDELPGLDDETRQRIDCGQMGVGDNDVIFTFYIKHTSDELETSTVALNDEELFPKA